MPLSTAEHLDNLTRHIDLVRGACLLLGRRLMAQGRGEFGRILISLGFQHDVSKFLGIEWDYMHAGNDVPKTELDLAIRQHVRTNRHHPEHWGGVQNMPEVYVAEMVCDWYARSQEFGTSLRDWIRSDGIEKYGLQGDRLAMVNGFVDVLLADSFVR